MSRTKIVNRVKAGWKQVVAQGSKSMRVIRRPRVAIGMGVGVVAIAAGAFVVLHPMGVGFHPWVAAKEAAKDVAREASALLPEKSVAELEVAIKAHPKDGALHMELGDALMTAGQRAEALRAYDRALELKAQPSEKMLAQLPMMFGTKWEEASAAILLKHHVTGAAPGLHHASSHPEYKTRWAAISLLQSLKRVDPSDYVAAWRQDLGDARCSVQKNAVENLGKYGDRRDLKRLRAADEKDEKSTPWFGITCLGSRPEDAEKAITAKVNAKPVLAKK